MLKWVETPLGAYAIFVIRGVEIARLEVTSTRWRVLGREGTRDGTAGSMEYAKAAAVFALEELLVTALVDVRSVQHLSKRPPGW